MKHYIFSEGNIKLYLDPEIDSLYFKSLSSDTTLDIFACCSAIEDLRRLKKLVVNEKFLGNLGRHSVRNDLGENCIEGPTFKLLSGLEELILVVRPENPHKGKSRGLSTLGTLFYERHCTACQKMDWWVGMDGWIFPTYSHFVTAERNGVENVFAENAYKGILQLQSRMRSQWLEGFVNRRMQNVCRVDFDRREGKIRACSVAGLHRFVDLLNE